MPRSLGDVLQDIATNIDRIEAYTNGRVENDLALDTMLMDAIERCLERISEASRAIPDDIKSNYPTVPWHDIAVIGNRLRHGYFTVDPSIIWQTATLDVPALRATIDDIGMNDAKHQ